MNQPGVRTENTDPTQAIEIEKLNLFPGALEDTRSDEAKAKDFQAEEIATFGLVDWQPKRFEDIKTFPVRNQDGSGSCVAFTAALMLGIENYIEEEKYIEFSAKDIYNRRSNAPGAGMIGADCLEILRKYGATLNALIPSDNQNETTIADINREISDEQIGQIFKAKGYVQFPFDVDKIAWTIESGRKNGVGKPVMVWFSFPLSEWNAVPTVTSGNDNIVRHSVTAVDYGTLNGVKGIFIQDSWGLHSSTVNGLRFLSEAYIAKRMIFCAHIVNLNNAWRDGEPEPTKPHFTFDSPLAFGQTSEDIRQLQIILQYEQLFPNTVQASGYFGEITRKAVLKWQEKYQIDTPENLTQLNGRRVGELTIKKLNEIYAD